MKLLRQIAAVAFFLAVPVSALAAPDPVGAALAKLGAEAIRSADSDLCFPADAEEYEALGKNGVIRIEAASAIATELPLRTAYLEIKGVKVPLRLILTQPKSLDDQPGEGDKTRYWRQVSFYLAPLNVIRGGADLSVDFTGARRDFGITSFDDPTDGPAFYRLDEYNTPSEPSADALADLLKREYPDDFTAH